MKKTLYIQIDNNSLPEGCGEDVEVLDCRCINDFCSMVGDALVSDLKDENGKPFYRLINPVGRLLMDFKDVDEKAFNSIIEDWYDILGNLLHKGQQEDVLAIKFPQQYVDWLTQNESHYYEQVGLELQKNRGILKLSFEDFVDDIVSSLSYKISHTLQDSKGDITFVVFSNPLIRTNSFVVKNVKFEDIEIMKYDSWNEEMRNRPQLSFTVGGVTFEMVRVEGGTFTMGATAEQGSDAYYDEKPEHQVTLNNFYIGKYEVTQELWQAVMGNNPSNFKGANRPVECISWDDCQEFICQLNNLTNSNFRLPTEAEWEYAARGGKHSRGYKYAGSNNLKSVAWYKENSRSETQPVGKKLPNELGLYDMCGNVWEWCQDQYGHYAKSSQTISIRASLSGSRIYRGGSWFDNARNCRSTRRFDYSPSYRYYYIGIRLAL